MSIKDKKQKVFGQIGAAKTLVNGMPKYNLTNSFPSVNNGNDPILFLTDLLKSLIGQSKFYKVIVEVLTKYVDKIEITLKQTIKKVLRSLVSCGINPSIPSFLKSNSTTGLVIEVDKIDFFDLFKTDPNSLSGRLLYNDITPALTDSSDFNTFLYGVIQNPNTTFTWKNILDFKFQEIGVSPTPNNSLIIKTNPSFDSSSLNDLNDNFVDSLTILYAKNIVNQIIDILFGTISVNVNKSRKQLEKEAEINDIIDRLSKVDENDEINDDYFTFTNDEIARQQETADNRRNGIIKIKTEVETNASLPFNQLSTFNLDYESSATLVEKRTTLENGINEMGDSVAAQVPKNEDKQTVKIGFAIDIIKNFIKSIANLLISPKVIIIFLINFKIIFGVNANYDGPVDFIKKNRLLFKAIFKDITQVITKLLLSYAMREITKLAAEKALITLIEKTQNRQQQLLSLVGVSQEALRRIKGLL
jgi:hypothetical protein